jgi:hypothetical protein
MFRFTKSHWQGQLPAYLSLFVILIGLRVIIHLIYGVVPSSLPLIGIVVFFTADVVLIIWQITGTLRASENRLGKSGDTLLYWGSYAASIVVVAIMIFDATTIISSRTGANPVPAISKTSLIVRGDTILISGDIDFGTYDAIESLLEETLEPITTVRLNSNGGRIYAARGIARILIWYRLDTEVDKRCISACTLVFLAGNRRKLREGAQLGFHQYAQASDVPLLDTAEEQEKDRLFLKARGVSESFLRKMFQAKHNDVWFPDRKELLTAGVITD